MPSLQREIIIIIIIIIIVIIIIITTTTTTIIMTALPELWNICIFATDRGDTNSKTQKKVKFHPVFVCSQADYLAKLLSIVVSWT